MNTMSLSLTFVLLVASLNLAAQDFQSFIDRVNSLADNGDKAAVVDSFMNAAPAFPYIEEATAYFIYRGTADDILAVGDFNGWNPGAGYTMENLSGTDFWYAGRVFELNARLDYKYILNGSDWILDPHNPNTVAGGFGPNSELSMPEYVQPWEIVNNPNIDKGEIINYDFESTALGATNKLKVYLPPGYDAFRWPGYAVAYFQDGFESVDLGKAVNVIDNLIDAGEIDEIIAVFVRPNNRSDEYAGAKRNQYLEFFTDELVPYIDGNYNTVPNERHRAVIGASLGGNISAYIAYTHPELFAHCGIHSGALWPNGNEVFNLITNGPAVDVKMVNIWGSYEGGLADQMGALQDHFDTAGYEHISYSLPEGHSWGLWRATFDDMLKFFFAFLTTSAGSGGVFMALDFNHDQAGNVIRYGFSLDKPQHFNVKLADMSGRIVHHKRYKGTGHIEGDLHVAELPAGIYHFILEFEQETISRKISVARP
jgi:enterochelin esterase family protein